MDPVSHATQPHLQQQHSTSDSLKQSAGFLGFGSFMNKVSVGEMLAPNYSFPENLPSQIPVQLPKNIIKCGISMRSQFLIDFSNWTFLNHGAFGSPLATSFEAAQKIRRITELNPLKFLDRDIFALLCRSIVGICKFLGLGPEFHSSTVLLPNATECMNVSVRNILKTIKPTQKIYAFNLVYGATKKCLQTLAPNQFEIFSLVVDSSTVSLEHQVLNVLKENIKTETPGALILDHITSTTALYFDLEVLLPEIRKLWPSIIICVDGAHALGAVDLNLSSLDYNYYMANCHKWLCNPRGCAVLTTKNIPNQLEPLVISHGADSGQVAKFIWAGSKDYSSIIALHHTLAFWNWFGIQTARTYMNSLCDSVCDSLVNTWKTKTYDTRQKSKFPMRLVQLPHLPGLKFPETGLGSHHTVFCQDYLYAKKIEATIKNIDSQLYIRVSCHVYSTFSELMKVSKSFYI